MLSIRVFGDNVLRKKATRIQSIDDDINNLINDMFLAMYSAEGIGLAAPQIGRSIRLFITDISPLVEDSKKEIFINPQIVEYGFEREDYEEGCLSLPTIREVVKRPSEIRLQWQDETGKEFDEWVDGYRARVIQHEYDHLEGKLFIDHISTLKRSLLKKTLKQITSGEIEVEMSEKFEL
jgi:peptide deformylase